MSGGPPRAVGSERRPMCPRPYASARRRRAADATRGRILEAARSLIGGRGDLGRFSVDAVARKAGVARMTVYYQFGSRSGLLEALADHLASRGQMQRMGEAFRAPTLEKGLRTLVETFVRFWATDRRTMRRLRAMGVVFPTTAGRPRDRDAWRREAVGALLRRHGVHRTGRAVSDGDLVDVLSALTSFEVFDLLRTGSRTPEEVADLVYRLAESALHDAR
jgi:AcrR family transcriptional regulator